MYRVLFLVRSPQAKSETLGSISWHEREQRPGEVSWKYLSVSATAGSSDPILQHVYRQSLDAMQMQHTTWGVAVEYMYRCLPRAQSNNLVGDFETLFLVCANVHIDLGSSLPYLHM